MSRPLRFLIAESEPPEMREARRESVGRSSGETYLATLRSLADGAACERVKPADQGSALPDRDGLSGYDAVFLTGSPLHLYQDSREARREVDFMRAVFASGTPSFGSCAGLQVAVVAAGGSVRPNALGREAGFSRGIVATAAGRDHPLLAGRPAAFDAPGFHDDEVESLPPDAACLAGNRMSTVQAAEIRSGEGVFWGVQYHPELSLHEVAAAVRRQADELLADGFAENRDTLDDYAGLIEALDCEPGRRDLAWRLGIDEQVTDPERRTAELRNFIAHLVTPTRARRGRS